MMRGRTGMLAAVAAMGLMAASPSAAITSNVDRPAQAKRRAKNHSIYMPQHGRNRGTGAGADRAYDREVAKAQANAVFYAHLPPASSYPLEKAA